MSGPFSAESLKDHIVLIYGDKIFRSNMFLNRLCSFKRTFSFVSFILEVI